MIEDLLFELLGNGKLKLIHDDPNFYQYECEDFQVDLEEKDGLWIVSIDLKSSFNKTSQSPIHFVYDDYGKFSKRKKKRIQQAINYLVANEKDAGGFFGRLPGFDDLDVYARDDFYR
jgi:hypothetical protein